MTTDFERPAKREMPEWKIRKSKQKRELMIVKCKQTWEQARVGHLSEKERRPLIDLLMSQITGHIEEVVFKHDASRMVQCCIKYGTPTDIKKIHEELTPRMLDLIKSTYGKYIVLALLNHLKSSRADIFELCKGRVEELLRNKDSAYLIEVIYHSYATPKQKKTMVSEMYCVQVKKSAQYAGMTLIKIIETTPSLKEIVKSHMKKLLFKLVQKGGLGDMTIILRALWEYLSIFDDADFVEMLQEQVIEFLHHKDGMCIANYIIRKASAKNRKIILKAFKPHLLKVWKEEYGHLVLISAFNCVDDTKMMQKNLITDIAVNVEGLDLLNCKYSRRTVSYLLTHSNKMVPNNYAVMLQEDEKLSLETSKKEPAIRFTELKEACEVEFMKFIIDNMLQFLVGEGIDLIESLIIFGSEDISAKVLKKMSECLTADLSLLENNKFGKSISRILKSDRKGAMVETILPFMLSNLETLSNSDAKYVLSAIAKENQDVIKQLQSIEGLDMTFWGKVINKS